MDEKQKKIAGTPSDQTEPEVLPLSALDEALAGIVGTDKAEVDTEAQKGQRRKAKSKGKKPTEQG